MSDYKCKIYTNISLGEYDFMFGKAIKIRAHRDCVYTKASWYFSDFINYSFEGTRAFIQLLRVMLFTLTL